MEQLCAYCRNCQCVDYNNHKSGKYPCTRENEWVYADGGPLKDRCYWQRPSYQMLGIDEAIKISKKYRGFYITTYIFARLGLTESEDLETLYRFRNSYLEASYVGQRFLEDYDVFAPRIAKLLELIDTDASIAKRLYDSYIVGTLELIRKNNLYKACELYISMYDHLKKEYIIEPYKNIVYKPFMISPIRQAV